MKHMLYLDIRQETSLDSVTGTLKALWAAYLSSLLSVIPSPSSFIMKILFLGLITSLCNYL